jgi:hypothetical protein
MEIEERIRNQIEAILINDAKNFNEIRQMASNDEPFDAEVLAEERNLYHRIINSYRNAVSEVNKLLEENVGSFSSFYRIIESIKEKKDFQEICSRIVDGILKDFGADYCSLLFPEPNETFCIEGIREERKFLRIHSNDSLLGSKEFERELMHMAEENLDCLNIEDVYKEPCFNSVDFPGVVRSVLCLPLFLRNQAIGFLILSHSLPKFFHDNHVRILRILGSYIAHLRFLHQSGAISADGRPRESEDSQSAEEQEANSVVLMSFDTLDSYGRRVPLSKDSVREIRTRIQKALEGRESVHFYRERELMVFMPGVSSDSLPGRIRCLREVFYGWKADRFEAQNTARINLGFSACEGEEELSRTLEIASLVMHPESDEDTESDPDNEA